jgi:hypothetical protein
MSTTTTDSANHTTRRDHSPQAPAGPPTRPAPPPKLRRRPILIAAAIAAICFGALLSVWAYTSTSNTHEVLAVREAIHRGETIDRTDLITVRIGVDPALSPVPGSALDTVVGKRAAMDMPAGGVVTAAQIADTLTPSKGNSVVGINLAAGLLPAGELAVGDTVRVVSTPGEQGDPTVELPDPITAAVVGIATDETTGNTIVNVQVPFADAPAVASLAATGKVALVLDSSER